MKLVHPLFASSGNKPGWQKKLLFQEGGVEGEGEEVFDGVGDMDAVFAVHEDAHGMLEAVFAFEEGLPAGS